MANEVHNDIHNLESVHGCCLILVCPLHSYYYLSYFVCWKFIAAGCKRLTEHSLSYLLDKCDNLMTVNFRGTNVGFVYYPRSATMVSLKLEGSSLISPPAQFAPNLITKGAHFKGTLPCSKYLVLHLITLCGIAALAAQEPFGRYRCVFVLPPDHKTSLLHELFGVGSKEAPRVANAVSNFKTDSNCTYNLIECKNVMLLLSFAF